MNFYSEEHEVSFVYETPDQALQDGIPLSIFSGELPALQATVKYLREHRELSFKEISIILKRAESTIRNTYNNVRDSSLIIADSASVPLTIFEKKLSPLESLVLYLIKQGLKNVTIADLLNLDPRTTSTVKRRLRDKGVLS